jgi:hypothetical protein
MSKIKEFYHEEICKGLGKIDDSDYEFEQHQLKLEAEKILEEEAHLEYEAEKAAFFGTFDVTGSYPF